MGLFNIKLDLVAEDFAEASFVNIPYKEARNAKSKFIHWIYNNQHIPCIVIMPDATQSEGIAESACKNLKADMIIQFERFGFVRVHKNDEKLITYYSHK
jgi:glutamyl-tRNA synthetase